jgi:hypothetical protein
MSCKHFDMYSGPVCGQIFLPDLAPTEFLNSISLSRVCPRLQFLCNLSRHFPTRAVQQLCTPKLPGNDRFCLQCLHLIPTCTATRHIPLFLYSRGFVARIRLTSLFVKLKCSRRSRTKHEYSRLISCPYQCPWPRHDSMTVHEVKTI